MKRSSMHNPPHPGEVLRELCLAPLNLTVTEAAASLDVSRNTLSAILNDDMVLQFGHGVEPWRSGMGFAGSC